LVVFVVLVGLCEEMKWNEMKWNEWFSTEKNENKVCQCQAQKARLKFIELFPSFLVGGKKKWAKCWFLVHFYS